MIIISKKKVLIVGANGVVGFAALKNFTSNPEIEVIAISRKKPNKTFGAEFHSIDLLETDKCKRILGEFEGVTHVVYCAVFEKNNLREGWLNEEQISNNDLMLKNVMNSLDKGKNPIKHVTLLQGTKAYGTHVGEFELPARENRTERKDIPNFYWNQEAFIRESQKDSDWKFTIFRPRIIFGLAIGSAMNIIPAIGVYAAVQKELGEPLHYPGNQKLVIMQAVSADLLAKAIEWAGESENANNEIFNITNGDVFVWHNVWPAIATSLEMEVGEDKPIKLQEFGPKHEKVWNEVREKYQLKSPDMTSFVRTSFEYADGYLNADENKLPAIVSTIKLHQAGFSEFLDTEKMFIELFKKMRQDKLLP